MIRLSSLLGLILMGVCVAAWGQTETVLHSFGSTSNDGYGPLGGLLMDSSGNLFGTASEGPSIVCDGSYVFGCGIVFELVKSSNGYTGSLLYSFGSNSPTTDGASPEAGLITDASGNLYGTTVYGGSFDCLIDAGADGCGTVFKLVKSPSGYTETVLYAFTGSDGAYPYAGLTMDSSGNLYGTTFHGGACGLGTVFELAKSPGGYTEQVLHSFGCTANDGSSPAGGVTMDAAGNLYGTAEAAGDMTACGGSGCGIVFELVNSNAGYTEEVLYAFTGTDGSMPSAGLIFDGSGNLYGTTQAGGTYGDGTIFELLKSSSSYTENVLYSFQGPGGSDGQTPIAGLLMDASGNLYGSTKWGGTGCAPKGCGTVFELTSSSGTYTENVLHWFGAAGDGVNPAGPLLMDSARNLYGSTFAGGAFHGGSAFKVNLTGTAPALTVSPSYITFSSQQLNVTSSPQTITVTNSGNAGLVFGSSPVAFSGANGADFAATADTCVDSTLAANATCQVSITYTPSLAGSEYAVLTFSDNATNGPQTLDLSGVTVSYSYTALSPLSLTFPPQLVGTTSPPQTVTLTNTGNFPLGITSISMTANYSETNNCGSSLAAQASCTINVSFAPTMGGGALVGSLSLTDNSGGGGASGVALSGTGMDFSAGLTFGSPSLVIISPGQTATYPLSVVPLGGYNQTVTLACKDAPPLATCSVSPATVALNGTAVVPAILTVTTTAPTLAAPHSRNWPGPPPIVLWVSVVGLFGLFRACLAASGGKAHRTMLILMTLLLLPMVFLSSCGAGGLNPSPGTPGTPAGTYTLTVIGTSGNLTNSSTVNLHVN